MSIQFIENLVPRLLYFKSQPWLAVLQALGITTPGFTAAEVRSQLSAIANPAVASLTVWPSWTDLLANVPATAKGLTAFFTQPVFSTVDGVGPLNVAPIRTAVSIEVTPGVFIWIPLILNVDAQDGYLAIRTFWGVNGDEATLPAMVGSEYARRLVFMSSDSGDWTTTTQPGWFLATRAPTGAPGSVLATGIATGGATLELWPFGATATPAGWTAVTAGAGTVTFGSNATTLTDPDGASGASIESSSVRAQALEGQWKIEEWSATATATLTLRFLDAGLLEHTVTCDLSPANTLTVTVDGGAPTVIPTTQGADYWFGVNDAAEFTVTSTVDAPAPPPIGTIRGLVDTGLRAPLGVGIAPTAFPSVSLSVIGSGPGSSTFRLLAASGASYT